MEREHITPQGVSVFHDKNESIHSFCLCLYVRAGSLFETKKENGISHFFEHIVFKNPSCAFVHCSASITCA